MVKTNVGPCKQYQGPPIFRNTGIFSMPLQF